MKVLRYFYAIQYKMFKLFNLFNRYVFCCNNYAYGIWSKKYSNQLWIDIIQAQRRAAAETENGILGSV